MTPVEFADIAFNWKAFDYQKEPLNDMSPRQIMACGRQVGKDRKVQRVPAVWGHES